MNPVSILYALSISCFLVAACIAAYLIYDWLRLQRGLREDAQLDHWPVRSYRTKPEWMRNGRAKR